MTNNDSPPLLVLFPTIYTLETTIGSKQLDEDNLIDKFLQNNYLATINIDGLKEEYLANLICAQGNSWVDLIIDGSDQGNVKIIEINPSKTLKIIPFISNDQE